MRTPCRMLIAAGILCLGAAITVRAQEPLEITLQEAVDRALRENHEVRRARERIVQLDGRIQEVKSRIYPQLGLEGSYARSYDESFLDTFDGFIAPEVRDRYAVATTVDQLLFSWGRVSGAVEIARESRTQTVQEVAATEREVKLRVHEAFYDLLLADRLVEVAEQTLAQRERTLDVARKRFEAGVINEFEVIRARVDVANAKPPVIRAQNRVRQVKSRLNNLLARNQVLPVRAKGELEYDPLRHLTLEQVVEQALARRPELESLRVARQIAEQSLEIAAAEDKPEVNLQAEYGFQTEEFQNLNPNREVWSARVVLSLPLFDGGRTRGLVAQASSQLQDARIAIDQLEEGITLEAKVALDDLKEAEEIIEASSLNIEQAETALELAETSFRYGVATILDVTDAELGVTVAYTDHARALHDYMLARARVLSVMNEL